MKKDIILFLPFLMVFSCELPTKGKDEIFREAKKEFLGKDASDVFYEKEMIDVPENSSCSKDDVTCSWSYQWIYKTLSWEEKENTHISRSFDYTVDSKLKIFSYEHHRLGGKTTLKQTLTLYTIDPKGRFDFSREIPNGLSKGEFIFLNDNEFILVGSVNHLDDSLVRIYFFDNSSIMQRTTTSFKKDLWAYHSLAYNKNENKLYLSVGENIFLYHISREKIELKKTKTIPGEKFLHGLSLNKQGKLYTISGKGNLFQLSNELEIETKETILQPQDQQILLQVSLAITESENLFIILGHLIFFVSKNGGILWKKEDNNLKITSRAIFAPFEIAWIFTDGYFIGINLQSGEFKYKIKNVSQDIAPLFLDNQQMILFIADEGLVKISNSGEILERIQTTFSIRSTFLHDKTLYIQVEDKYLNTGIIKIDRNMNEHLVKQGWPFIYGKSDRARALTSP